MEQRELSLSLSLSLSSIFTFLDLDSPTFIRQVLERNFPLRPSSKAAKSLLSPISPRPSSSAASEKLGQLTAVQDNVSFLALGKRVLADQGQFNRRFPEPRENLRSSSRRSFFRLSFLCSRHGPHRTCFVHRVDGDHGGEECGLDSGQVQHGESASLVSS